MQYFTSLLQTLAHYKLILTLPLLNLIPNSFYVPQCLLTKPLVIDFTDPLFLLHLYDEGIQKTLLQIKHFTVNNFRTKETTVISVFKNSDKETILSFSCHPV